MVQDRDDRGVGQFEAAARISVGSRRGRYGSERCSFQAVSTRCIRSRSREYQVLDRVPVGVQHEQPAAGAQHAPRLGQRSLDVVDVLLYLSGDRDVEPLVPER